MDSNCKIHFKEHYNAFIFKNYIKSTMGTRWKGSYPNELYNASIVISPLDGVVCESEKGSNFQLRKCCTNQQKAELAMIYKLCMKYGVKYNEDAAEIIKWSFSRHCSYDEFNKFMCVQQAYQDKRSEVNGRSYWSELQEPIKNIWSDKEKRNNLDSDMVNFGGRLLIGLNKVLQNRFLTKESETIKRIKSSIVDIDMF